MASPEAIKAHARAEEIFLHHVAPVIEKAQEAFMEDCQRAGLNLAASSAMMSVRFISSGLESLGYIAKDDEHAEVLIAQIMGIVASGIKSGQAKMTQKLQDAGAI